MSDDFDKDLIERLNKRDFNLKNRTRAAEMRGELHLGQEKKQHYEYNRDDVPVIELADKQASKNPHKGDSKG